MSSQKKIIIDLSVLGKLPLEEEEEEEDERKKERKKERKRERKKGKYIKCI